MSEGAKSPIKIALDGAPNIAGITVALTDGRWQHFTAEDMVSVMEFGGTFKVWRLLEFITSLAPEPLPVEHAEITNE